MKILGHRGAIVSDATAAKQPYYQNSLNAQKIAFDYADGDEGDWIATADGELIRIHQSKFIFDTVEYCAAEHLDPESASLMGDRKFIEMTSEEVKKLRLKNGEKIPFFEDYINLASSYGPEKVLNLELLGEDVVSLILPKIHKAVADKKVQKDQFLISSFNHYALEDVRREDPDIKIGVLFSRPDQPKTKIHPWYPQSKGMYTPFNAENIASRQVTENIKPEFVIISEATLTENAVEIIRKTLPDAKIATWIFTGLQTDDVETFPEKIEKWGRDGTLAAIIIDEPKSSADRFRKLVSPNI